MQIHIFRTQPADIPAVTELVRAAFGETQSKNGENARLIADLLDDPTAQPTLSLAAEAAGNLVGTILFSRVGIKNNTYKPSASILAPLAVHPDYQKQGIGGRLIREGIQQLIEMDRELVFVLGHPGYYPRFGFIPAGIKRFQPPYPLPAEHAGAWMVRELQPGIVGKTTGAVIPPEALDDPRYW